MTPLALRGLRGHIVGRNLGKKAHANACGYPICPFYVDSGLCDPLSLNNIETDEKELKMLTKGLK